MVYRVVASPTCSRIGGKIEKIRGQSLHLLERSDSKALAMYIERRLDILIEELLFLDQWFDTDDRNPDI